MKIYTTREAAQDILGLLRNYGEQATLLSTSYDKDESVIVVKTIPERIKQWVKDVSTRIEEDSHERN